MQRASDSLLSAHTVGPLSSRHNLPWLYISQAERATVQLCADGDRSDKSAQIGGQPNLLNGMFIYIFRSCRCHFTNVSGGKPQHAWMDPPWQREEGVSQRGPGTRPLLHVTEQVRNISSC